MFVVVVFWGIILFVLVFVLLFYGFFSVVGVLFCFVCFRCFTGFFVFVCFCSVFFIVFFGFVCLFVGWFLKRKEKLQFLSFRKISLVLQPKRQFYRKCVYCIVLLNSVLFKPCLFRSSLEHQQSYLF